jgi:hypothetical protein
MSSSDRRPHLLLLALFFPPSRASGVFRPLGFANHLVHLGWDVTVVTADAASHLEVVGSIDPALEALVDPAVRVVRVPVPRQHLVTEPKQMAWWRANLPGLLPAWEQRHNPAGFPDRWATWGPPAVRRAVAHGRRHRADVVMATGNPWVGFWAAAQVAAALKLPYVLDYRDAWTLNQFTGEDRFGPDSAEAGWERRLVAGAARVLFVCEGQRAWHAARYPPAAGAMRVIENGFDADQIAVPPFRAAGSPLRFGWVGTMTVDQPHQAMWQGWRQALAAEPVLAGAQAYLYGHLGYSPGAQRQVSALIPATPSSGLVLAGPCTRAELGAVYGSLDVLLDFTARSPYVVGGKLYEEMALGRPIAAVVEPAVAAGLPSADYPLWFGSPAVTPEGVRQALVAAAAAARAMTPAIRQAALDKAAGFARGLRAAELDRELRGLLS